MEKDPEELLEEYDKEHEGDDEDKDIKGDEDAGTDDKSKSDDTDDTKKEEVKTGTKPEIKEPEGDELQDLAKQLKESPLSNIDDDWVPANYKELIEKTKEVMDTENHNAKVKEEIATKESEALQKKANELMDNEIAELVKDGKLPEVKDAMDETDPGVKRQVEVYNYMAKMNKIYADKGLTQRFTSFNLGLTNLEAEEAAKRIKEDEAKEGELNKKRAGLVGGGTPSSKSKPLGFNPPKQGETLSEALEDVINSL